jgi:hypothetical protein
MSAAPYPCKEGTGVGSGGSSRLESPRTWSGVYALVEILLLARKLDRWMRATLA